MKRFITLLILALILAGMYQTQAQTTVTIGTGTLTSYMYGPIYRSSSTSSFDFSKYDYLILDSELAAQGITSGAQITKVAWNKSSTFASTGNATYSVWIKNSSLTTLVSGTTWGTVKSGATQAYVSTTQTIPGTAGWIEFTFASPFTYTGGSLEIATDWDCSMIAGNPSTGAYNWYYTSGLAFNGTIGWASSTAGTDATALSTSSYGGTLRPNIQITYIAGAPCSGTPTPGNTISSANPACPTAPFFLSLQNSTPGSGVSYVWEYSLTGSDPWTSFGTSSPSVSTSQTVETYYRCQVTCDGNTGISTPLLVTMNPFYNCYCPSSATSAADEEIFNVTVGSMSTTSDCSTLAPGPGSVVGMYSNYTTSVTPPDLMVGFSVAFSVQIGTCGGNYGNAVKIFIDYNQNGAFTDAGEEVYVSPASTTGPHIETGSFTVPLTATLGNTRMRVVNVETAPSSITPCGTYSWGETEDYLVNISSATAPYLSVVPTSIPFGYVGFPGTSAEIPYSLSGDNLTASPIVVTAPTGFEVSLSSGSGFGPTVDVAFTPPTLGATDVWVRFVPTGPGLPFSGNVTNVGGGASINVAVSGSSDYASLFCAASGGCDEYISNVTVGTINNSSGCTNYADYTALSTNMAPGNPYAITVTNGTPYASDQCGIWVDWNKDGDFGDPDETIAVTGTPGTGPYTATITPPAGTPENSVRMRIRITYTGAVDPCGTTTYGEVEDYTINVQAPLAHDAGFLSFDNITPDYFQSGTIQPKVTFMNFGTNTETFDVNLTINPGGYTSTKTITGLGAGLSEQATFDDWTAVAGNTYTITACSQLVGDLQPANDCGNRSTFVYNVNNTAIWSSGSVIPTGNYLGTGASYTSITDATNYVFVVGGNTTLGTEVFKYNVSTDTWETKASLPAGRRVLASAVVGDFLYAIAGSDMSSVYQSTMYKYDINADTWSDLVAPLPVALGWVKAVSYDNNYIYVAGGVDAASTVVNTVYLYNVTTDTWTTATSLPGPIFGGAFAINGDYLVYAAGADLAVISNTVYVGQIDPLDPTVITWGIKSPFPGIPTQTQFFTSRKTNALSVNDPITKIDPPAPTDLGYPAGPMYRFDGATWQGDRVIVATGSPTAAWTPANPNPCYTYDPVGDVWTRYTDVPVPVLGSCLGSANEGTFWKLIVATGYNGTAAVTNTQILTEDFSACVMPSGLQAVPDINSAQLSWTENGAAALWDIEYGDQGFSLGTGTQVLGVTNPYNLGGLLDNHNYAYYVRSDCGGTQSAWSGPKNFTTLCTPVTMLPHTESFTTWPPSCWLQAGGTRTWAQYAGVPCAYANFWGWTVPNNALMTSQAVNLAGYTGAHLVFKWSHQYNATYPGDQLIVNISDDGGLTWDEVWNITGAAFDSQDGAGSTTPGTFATKVIDLTPYLGSTILVQFNAVSGYGPDLFLDEVLITDTKHVNVKLMLEGLWNGTGMNEAMDDMGNPQWGPGVADRVDIELHDAVAPYGLLGTIVGVDVATDGTTDRIIGCEWVGPYYLAILHRNSIQTWSAAPVNFLAYPVVYDFSTANTQAFGDNQQNLGGGAFGFYGGDVNLDWVVDSNDLGDVDNDSNNFVFGYVATDANGDGIVDSNDLGLVDNNANAFIMVITP